MCDAMQMSLFDFGNESNKRVYGDKLCACENGKGVLDVDTVKGCYWGMLHYPDGGCYGACYALKLSKRSGIDFSVSINRRLCRANMANVFSTVKNHKSKWYRVGTNGDPCHDWKHTISILRFLSRTGKIPVIVTKHWIALSDNELSELSQMGAIINTSVSAMDTEAELTHRLCQIQRIRRVGMSSITRVVTCRFGNTETGKAMKYRQEHLMALSDVIDTPFRCSKNNPVVQSGDVILNATGGWNGTGQGAISLHMDGVYLGTCNKCPDQCGYKKP